MQVEQYDEAITVESMDSAALSHSRDIFATAPVPPAEEGAEPSVKSHDLSGLIEDVQTDKSDLFG